MGVRLPLIWRVVLTAGLICGHADGLWAAMSSGSYVENHFKDGSTWTYLEDGAGYVTETVLAGTVLVNGVWTKVVETSGGSLPCKEYISKDAGGYYIHRTFEPNVFVEGWGYADLTATLSPPINIPPTFDIGEVATSNGTASLTISDLGTFNFNYTFSIKFVGFENVTTPLGSFNTLKSEQSFTMWGYVYGDYISTTSTEESWDVPYLGCVKSVLNEDGKKTVSELYSTNIDLNVTVDNLSTGWNLVAFGCVPLNPAMDSVLTGFKEDVISVWKWANDNWAVYLPNELDNGAAYAAGKGFTLLTGLSGGEGFWVNIDVPPALTVAGAQPADLSLSLSGGWNLIGLKSNQSQAVTDLISGQESKIISIWKWENSNWAVYLPGEGDGGEAYAGGKGFNELSFINPGEGFWINCTGAIILQ